MNGVPQLRTRKTLLGVAGCHGGGLVAAGGMRLYPLAGQPLGFGYLFASHPHIRIGVRLPR